jgi:hypothetical protein
MPTRPARPISAAAQALRLRPKRHLRHFQQWRRTSLLLGLLLSACGGGGGGGGSSDATAGGHPTAAVAFPFGVSWGPATALASPSDVPTGSTGVSDLGLGTSRTPAQALVSAQVDAIANGRISLASSGWADTNALFNTAVDTHASCWSPAVAYAAHDDSPGASGTLPAGEVSLWRDHDASDPQGACAVAEVNTQLNALGAQAHQAMLMLSALRWRVAGDNTLGMPNSGQRTDLTAVAGGLLQPVLSGVSVAAASVAVNDDGSEQIYRLLLTRGSGASAQSLELTLLHTPADTDTHFAGTLQVALSYLGTDANLGCSDQRDGSGRYKLARLLSLGYNRQDEWMSLRARSGLYCGNGNPMSASQMTDLGSLTLSGELDPAMYLSGSTRGGVAGWRKHFTRWSSDHLVSAQTSDFLLAWQAQPQGGAGHAHLLAGHSALSTSTSTRQLSLAKGHTDDISVTDGVMLGLVCNVNGPGANATVFSGFQWQQATLGPTDTSWKLSASQRQHAPTNACAASGSMRFDVNGDGNLGPTEGQGTQADLVTPSQTGLDAQDELNVRGFLSPVLLL